MNNLLREAKKELGVYDEKGLSNGADLEAAGKFAKLIKDLLTIEAMEDSKMRDYNYRGRDDYGRRYQGDDYMDGGYGRQRDSRGRYMTYSDERMNDHLNRIIDGYDMYQYGRERYRAGDSEERVHDGLEKLMYAICSFVESTMDFAETPQEKEIIRKHIQKMAKI